MSARPGLPGRRRRRLLWTMALLLAGGVAATAVGGWLWLSRDGDKRLPGEVPEEITSRLSRDLPAGAPEPRLTDVTAASGLGGFRNFAGARSSQLPEDMGPGAAWGDFDNDGDEDLFLVAAGGSLDLPAGQRAASRLFENLGDGTFSEVADFPDIRILGMAAAWADVDGDGDEDLAVSGHNALLLLRNDGGRLRLDPGFPSPPGFWAGLAWGDADGDGDLDLYVCGYVDYQEPEGARQGASRQYGQSVPYTLNPASYPPLPNLLLRNDGAGRFADAAAELGIANPEGRSLQAVWHDFDQDGRLDLYVANDISDNALFRSTGAGFEDISHAAWVADYRGAMGLAVGDYDGDGDDDLFVTHWVAQENALYSSLLADGAGAGAGLRFMDLADREGLGQIALPLVGWGAEFADLDGDGWLDLPVANGSTFETDQTPRRLRPMRSFLFWREPGGGFHDLAAGAPALARPAASRGLAVADYDADGDLDLLLTDHGEGVRLLRNDMQAGRWLKLRLHGAPAGRGEGAVVLAQVAGRILRRSISPASYLSQSTREVHIGLGESLQADGVVVRWPGGEEQEVGPLAAGGTYGVRRGRPGAALLSRQPPTRDEVAAFWRLQRAAMEAVKVAGDCAGAIQLFEQALALDPVHEDSLYYLSQCLADQGRTEEALERLGALIRVNPQSHRAHRQWAFLRASGDAGPQALQDATAALERAVAINPEETGALELLGEIDLMRGDLAAAERHLALACQTNPQAAKAFFLRGYVAWMRGNTEAARAHLQAASPARPQRERLPEGATGEGDVQRRMHQDPGVLREGWRDWDGASEDLEAAFAPLARRLGAPLPPEDRME